MRILWLYSDWQQNDFRRDNNLYGAISYYRVIKPAQILKYDIDVVGAEFLKWGVQGEGMEHTKYQRFAQYDLIISKHARDAKTASDILAAAKYYKKKVLVDIDDNYLAMRPDNPAFKDYAYGQGPREFVGAFISLADGMTVSTNPLRKVYKGFNKQIDVLPNCNDVNDWPKERKVWDDGKIRIGFAGGQGHLADLNLILEPMSYILAKYPNVIFEIVGAIEPKIAMLLGLRMNEHCKRDITKQFRIGGGTMAWKGYPELLNSFGWDIVIAPLINEPFNRCKSHIRWMESSMVGCPVIASPVYPYYSDVQTVKTIEDGRTGFLAYNSEDWFNYLDTLVKEKDLRKTVADNAYNYIKDHWQYSQWADKWERAINKYL